MLLVGSVIGVQFGTTIGAKISGAQFRILLAVLVLVTCGKMAIDLIVQPTDLYSLQFIFHAQ